MSIWPNEEYEEEEILLDGNEDFEEEDSELDSPFDSEFDPEDEEEGEEGSIIYPEDEFEEADDEVEELDF